MANVIEDEATRAREWNKEMKKRYHHYKQIDVPDIILQDAKQYNEMSYTDYLVDKMNSQKEQELKIKAYFDTHKPEKKVVDFIYDYFENKIQDKPDVFLTTSGPESLGYMIYGKEEGWHIIDDEAYSYKLYQDIIDNLVEKELIKRGLWSKKEGWA
jgi:hypothetical protein